MAVEHPLFTPFDLSESLSLKNRIVMAPCTRDRANNSDERVPTLPRMADHYALRAEHGFGLLVAEATQIGPGVVGGPGYISTSGIWNEEQTEAWKAVVDAVKASSETPPPFICQLWHCGRHSHPDYLGGEIPWAPSAVPIGGKTKKLVPGWVEKEYVAPKAMTRDDMEAVIEQFRIATRNSLEAGFDGVEIHSANGYLLDQFLRTSSNKRTDEFGGSIENRVRFVVEVVEAVIEAAGNDPKKVGIRFSPIGASGDMHDEDPMALFTYVMEKMDSYGLLYIHFNEEAPEDLECDFAQLARAAPNTPFIACYRYTLDRAANVLKNGPSGDGYADLVAWGTWQVANPDLPKRFAKAVAEGTEPQLNEVDWSTCFSEGDAGYNDYPLMSES